MCRGSGYMGHFSTSAQFCCEYRTALKKKKKERKSAGILSARENGRLTEAQVRS